MRLSGGDRRTLSDFRILKRHFGEGMPMSALAYMALSGFCTTRAREDKVKVATIGHNSPGVLTKLGVA